MHNLVLDIGNTNSKLGIFLNRELIVNQTLDSHSPEVILDFVEQYQVERSAISSVSEQPEELIRQLSLRTHYIPFSTKKSIGVTNKYGTPETLGQDRWAKVLAAHALFNGRECLIIDSGTCITYDVLHPDATYYGGSISPGINMRFEALHQFTKRLPLVKWDRSEIHIPQGTDSLTAIKRGVLQGIVNEVTGYIQEIFVKNPEVVILFTGGDATFLLKQLKNSIFAPQIIYDPLLVLKGLNEVIEFEYVQKN